MVSADGDVPPDPDTPKADSNSNSSKSNQPPAKRGRKPKVEVNTAPVRKRQRKPASVPENWQRKYHATDKMVSINLSNAKWAPDQRSLELEDGSSYHRGDHVYVHALQVGEPWGVARVLDFPVTGKMRVNWLKRAGSDADTRELLLTMEVDTVDVLRIRGKCSLVHSSECTPKYRNSVSHFWFGQFWDATMRSRYDVVPASKLVNLPEQVQSSLQERFAYFVMEHAKSNEMCSPARECGVCSQWCADADSVGCKRCHAFCHSACLAKKPQEKWTCPSCSRDGGKVPDQIISPLYPRLVDAAIAAPSVDKTGLHPDWPFRYLGIHCDLTEVFSRDAPLAPRRAPMVGSEHQLAIPEWPGRPVQYYRTIRPSRRKRAGETSDAASGPKEQEQKITFDPPDLDRSLPWVQEVPKGYVDRGNDRTTTAIWTNEFGDPDAFLERAQSYAERLDVSPHSTNFIDAALKAFHDSSGQSPRALQRVARLSQKNIHQPSLSPEEVKKFEQSIKEHGADMHAAFRTVGTRPFGDIVNFYYSWKKTPEGQSIWGNCDARASFRKLPPSDFLLSIISAEDPEIIDGSAVSSMNKSLVCKHCATTNGKVWRCAPGRQPVKKDRAIRALCPRCARLWYRYGAVWLPPSVVLPEKKQVEPELLEDARAISNAIEKQKAASQTPKEQTPADGHPEPTDVSNDTPQKKASAHSSDIEHRVDEEEDVQEGEEDLNDALDKRIALLSRQSATAHASKNQANYCAVCCQLDPSMAQLNCSCCGMCIHAACYGFSGSPQAGWLCDCCSNDLTEPAPAERQYFCALCPVKLVSYPAWLAGEKTGAPDALKRTIDRQWVHVRCAMCVKGVKFDDPNVLQPITYDKRPKDVPENVCSLCQGSTCHWAACDVCDKVVHPGCAGTSGDYAIGIQFKPHTSGDSSWRGSRGRMEATVRCADHGSDGLIPISEIDSDQGLTALQVFARSKRAPSDRLAGASAIADSLSDTLRTETRSIRPFIVSNDPEAAWWRHASKMQCAQCGSLDRQYWFETTDLNLICPNCKWGPESRKENGVPSELTVSLEEASNKYRSQITAMFSKIYQTLYSQPSSS